MIRKLVHLTPLVLLAVYFNAAPIFAQDTTEELKARLINLREKKTQLTIGYEENLHNVNMAADEKMGKIKSEFREAREECLRERRAKAKELLKDYEGKIKPMIREEEGLIELIGPQEGMNFAQTKAEKRKAGKLSAE